MSLAKLKSLSNAVLKLGPGKQILAFPQNLSGGRIHASSPNEVWQADTASMFTFGDSAETRGYFLCIVDVFTRRTWAEPMASATPGEVKRVLESIGQKPRMLDTDLGNEFKGELQPYLKEKQIAHRTKDPKDLNALATADRKIQQIKKAIASMQMEQNTSWRELLPKVVKGINESPSEALMDKAPADVASSENAIFDIQKANAAKAEETEQKQKDHKQKVFAAGAVRRLLGFDTEPHTLAPQRRSFKPTYSGHNIQPHSPDGVKFYTSEGTEDYRGSLVNLGTEANPKLVPVRHVQPIDKDTREAVIPQNLLGGKKLFDQRKERLTKVADQLAAQLRRVKRMFWRPTQRGQGPNQIVTLWLRRIPEVKPADRTGGAWKFWQKAYPSKFTVKPARTPTGVRVIVFYPVDKDGDEEDRMAQRRVLKLSLIHI